MPDELIKKKDETIKNIFNFSLRKSNTTNSPVKLSLKGDRVSTRKKPYRLFLHKTHFFFIKTNQE